MRRAIRCGICVIFVSVTPSAVLAQDPQATVPARSVVQTIKDDLKSAVSKESASLLSIATAFALFASPFDKTLTYSASSSTFLKTTFEPGREWRARNGSSAAARSRPMRLDPDACGYRRLLSLAALR